MPRSVYFRRWFNYTHARTHTHISIYRDGAADIRPRCVLQRYSQGTHGGCSPPRTPLRSTAAGSSAGTSSASASRRAARSGSTRTRTRRARPKRDRAAGAALSGNAPRLRGRGPCHHVASPSCSIYMHATHIYSQHIYARNTYMLATYIYRLAVQAHACVAGGRDAVSEHIYIYL